MGLGAKMMEPGTAETQARGKESGERGPRVRWSLAWREPVTEAIGVTANRGLDYASRTQRK